jgi:hypothetical protein
LDKRSKLLTLNFKTKLFTDKAEDKKKKQEEKSDTNPPKEAIPVAESKPIIPAPVSAPPTKDTQKQVIDTPAPVIAQTDVAPASVATATPKNQSAFHRPDNAPLTPSTVETPGYIAPPVAPSYHTPAAVHHSSAYQYPYSPNPLSTPQSYLPPPHGYAYPEPYGMPTYHPSSTYAPPYSPYLPAEGTPYSAYHHHPLAPTQPSTYPYPPYPPTMPQQWQ